MWALAIFLLLLGGCATPATSAAQDAEPPGSATPPPPQASPEPPADDTSDSAPPPLGLDRLLRPPGTLPTPAPVREARPGGKDRATWQREFAELRAEVADLEDKIEQTRVRLRDNADTDWGYSPTGGGIPSDPEVLKLRAQLRRDRQSLEAARRRLRDLQVEASLAGVPDHWRTDQP